MSSVAPLSAAATGTSAAAPDALNKLSADFNNFLTLLTTQLKNQDPMSPMDSTQFTSQLVAFTGVEQQINTNTKLDQMIKLDKSSLMTSAAAYIGTEVEATAQQVWLPDGGTGASIGYTLPEGVTAAAMAIYNASGQVVRNGAVPITQGHNVVAWDGKNDAGSAVPPGLYAFSIQGLDKDGKPVSGITTSSLGVVTNVSTDETSGTLLSIGALQVPLSSVISVKKPS
jgi:flagellar basal-body rod modification protein FlgD